MLTVGDAGSGPFRQSAALTVRPESLLSAAAKFDDAADIAQDWLSKKAHALTMQPLGADKVSVNAAQWFSENASGELGAIPAMREALVQLRNTARELREAARGYGLTDAGNAATQQQIAGQI